jgi:monovalent cation:proton antiporter-2 (CPA2) family protein
LNAHHAEFGFFLLAVVFLGATVLAVPLARRVGVSAVVAYILIGILLGPFGLGIFQSPGTLVAIAELGVVLLLFLIGLELQLDRLLAMRRLILGLGAAQLTITTAVIALLAYALDLLPWRGAIVAGLALALSSTAIALQILEERGHMQLEYGQRAFAILLFQDMAVVPILALLPLMAPIGNEQTSSLADGLLSVLRIGAAIALLVVAGRYLLNPFFRILAQTGAREVMTAAALLIVLGSGLLMQAAGMSMALGAFLAGVLLAESNYRHELEADVEPFRGLLLALFFMGVGMTIDLGVVWAHLSLIVIAAIVVALLKVAIVWVVFSPSCVRWTDALRAGSVLSAASEFAFVLLPVAGAVSVLTSEQVNIMGAVAALTMLLGPPVAAASDVMIKRLSRTECEHPVDDFSDARGSVLIIGFGRFGQIVSQCLLAQGIDVTTIDRDPEMIESAGRFGFKVYYGDGTRIDVLRAARAAKARLIAVCVNEQAVTNQIVDLIRIEFPNAKVYVRSYDRRHSLELIAKGVDYEIRETFESALKFGRNALEGLGVDAQEAAAIEQDVRDRDLLRLGLQQTGGELTGLDVLHRKRAQPEPLRTPERPVQPLNPEAEEIIKRKREAGSASG